MGRNRNAELIKNTIIIAFGQICTKFLWILLLPIYTQILEPEEFGLFDLYSTYWMLLGFVIFLQIEQGIFRFLIDVRKDVVGQKAIISTGFLGVLVNSGFFAVFFLIIGVWVDEPYIYFLLTITLAASWSVFFLQVCRGIGDNKAYAIGGVISAVVNLLLNIILVFLLKMGVVGLFYGVLFGNIACALFLIISKKLWNYICMSSFDKALFQGLLKYSIPLIPNSISWWVVYASDRSITAIVLGTAANGVLAVASRFSTVLSNAYNIFHLSWVESASEHIDDRDATIYFERVINTAVRCFFALFIVALPLFSICFPYMIERSYEESYLLFPMYFGAAMLNVVQGLYSVVYVAKKKTKELAKTTMTSAAVNMLVYVALVKQIGLLAAGISTVISYMLVTVWRYFDVQRDIRATLDGKFLVSMCAMAIVVLYAYYGKALTENVIVFLAALFYAGFINRKLVCTVFAEIHKRMANS